MFFDKKADSPTKYVPFRLIEDVEKGDREAQFILACAYLTGNYRLEKDNNKAVELLSLSANQGLAVAEYNLGAIFENKDKEFFTDEPAYTSALAYFLSAAEKGFPLAMLMVGEYYFFGYGTAQHYLKAKEWLEKAASYGLVGAQLLIGKIYMDGLGVEKNLVEAYKNLNLASIKGNSLNDEHDKTTKIEEARALKEALEKLLTIEELLRAQDLSLNPVYKIPEDLWPKASYG